METKIFPIEYQAHIEGLQRVLNVIELPIALIEEQSGKVLIVNLAFQDLFDLHDIDFTNYYIWQLLPKHQGCSIDSLSIENGLGTYTTDIMKPNGEIAAFVYKKKTIMIFNRSFILWFESRPDAECAHNDSLSSLYELFFQESDDAMAILEYKGNQLIKYLDANKAASNRYGLTLEQMQERISNSPAAIIAHGMGHFDRETTALDKDKKQICVHTRVRRIRYGKREIGLAIQRDITQIKQFEQQLDIQLKNELELRQKLEVQLQRHLDFSKALVHELKSPLTAIMCSCDHLKEKRSPAMTQKLINNISLGSNMLKKRIDEILDLAKSETESLLVEFKEVDPVAIIDKVAELYYDRCIRCNQKIVIRKYGSIPFVQGDPDRLFQVIANIVDNALKFNRPFGIISISINTKAEVVKISVHDQGIGIDPPLYQRIFEPYFCIDPQNGLGIGLSLSRSIIRLHGGDIIVNSKKGKGSTFVITLPIVLQ